MTVDSAQAPEQPLSIREVVIWLRDHKGVRPAVATIHRWINQGVRGTFLPSQRVGGMAYVTLDDLEAFLAACDQRRPLPPKPEEVSQALVEKNT